MSEKLKPTTERERAKWKKEMMVDGDDTDCAVGFRADDIDRLIADVDRAASHEAKLRARIAELETQIASAVAAEREACAKVCEDWPLKATNMEQMLKWNGDKPNAVSGSIYMVAAAIRARSESESKP